MKVQTRTVDSVMIARLAGEIDAFDTEGFGESLDAIVAAKPAVLVLDFEGVNYIASMGLSLLLRVARDMRLNGGALAIAAVTPAVKTVLDTVHLGQAIPVEPSVEAAIKRLRKSVAVG